jgi:hypothetical protein
VGTSVLLNPSRLPDGGPTAAKDRIGLLGRPTALQHGSHVGKAGTQLMLSNYTEDTAEGDGVQAATA